MAARAAGKSALGATAGTAAPKRRPRSAATARKRVAVVALPAPRLVEDDTEWLAAEHAARDAQLLDLLARLSA